MIPGTTKLAIQYIKSITALVCSKTDKSLGAAGELAAAMKKEEEEIGISTALSGAINRLLFCPFRKPVGWWFGKQDNLAL